MKMKTPQRPEPSVTSTPRLFASAVVLMVSALLAACGVSKQMTTDRIDERPVIVYQPSHQSDTGVNFNEGLVCNAIIEGAMASSNNTTRVHKVWSYNAEGLHHARQGSNTKIEHTSAVDSLGRISGYAYEIRESNRLHPNVFIAVHNNGATNRSACWGYVHEGDEQEPANRELATELVTEVCKASGLENGGVLGDSSPNRNDYRCRNTGKLSFYSLDENVNQCPLRVLLEIGDNKESYDLLMNPLMQNKIGKAIQTVVERRFGSNHK